MTMAAATTWSELPLEILGAILIHLTSADHLRLSAVCVSWRAVVKSCLFPPGRPEAPWLMLPDNLVTARRGGLSHAAAFYALSERRVHRIALPYPPIASRLCIGSAVGWLVTIAEPCELHLVNPFTRAQIPLPFVGSHHVFVDGIPPFIKAVLDGNPPATSPSPNSSRGRSRYTVVLLSRKGTSLAVAMEGEERWATIRLRHMRCRADGVWRRCRTATDILFHKGKLRIVDPVEGTIAAWLPSTDTTDLSTAATRFRWNVSRHWCYLAESSAGDLLLVARKTAAAAPDGAHLRTTGFDVFKVGETWRRTTMVRSLGDDSLFVGSNQSLVVSTREFPELRQNCVYFTGMMEAFQCCPGQPPDVGVYSLHDRRIDPFTDDDLQLAWPPPIWLAPPLV